MSGCLLTLSLIVAADPAPVTLFTAGEGDYASYRIPALVVTAKGTLLAFCEARKTASDWAEIEILSRRSNDGVAWSAPAIVGQTPTGLTRNPLAPKAQSGPTRNNPVPITDTAGPVHLLYCAEYSRCFYRRSNDDGHTWSAPVEITRAFEEFHKTYGWKVLATGPGHGIVLSKGPKKGRLIVPVWLSTGTGGNAHRPSVTGTIYSDDAGKTWHAGTIAVPNAGDFINPNEASIVERADGSVLLNVRTESKRHRRVTVVSADGATDWSEPRFADDLVEPICFGSSVRFDAKRILFANPDNLTVAGKEGVPGRGRERKNLTVRISSDDGKTWSKMQSLDSGPSGYSDLAVGKGGEVYCLYEKNGKPTSLTFLTIIP